MTNSNSCVGEGSHALYRGYRKLNEVKVLREMGHQIRRYLAPVSRPGSKTRTPPMNSGPRTHADCRAPRSLVLFDSSFRRYPMPDMTRTSRVGVIAACASLLLNASPVRAGRSDPHRLHSGAVGSRSGNRKPAKGGRAELAVAETPAINGRPVELVVRDSPPAPHRDNSICRSRQRTIGARRMEALGAAIPGYKYETAGRPAGQNSVKSMKLAFSVDIGLDVALGYKMR